MAHLMPNSANRSFGIRMSEFHAVNLNRLGPTWDTTLPVACCSRRLWHQHVFAIFLLVPIIPLEICSFSGWKNCFVLVTTEDHLHEVGKTTFLYFQRCFFGKKSVAKVVECLIFLELTAE